MTATQLAQILARTVQRIDVDDIAAADPQTLAQLHDECESLLAVVAAETLHRAATPDRRYAAPAWTLPQFKLNLPQEAASQG